MVAVKVGRIGLSGVYVALVSSPFDCLVWFGRQQENHVLFEVRGRDQQSHQRRGPMLLMMELLTILEQIASAMRVWQSGQREAYST